MHPESEVDGRMADNALLSPDYVVASDELFRRALGRSTDVLPIFAMARWSHFVDDVFEGYVGDEYSLLNDAGPRSVLEEFLTPPPLLGYRETAKVRQGVDVLDARLQAVWRPGVLRSQAAWWLSGAPCYGTSMLVRSLGERGVTIDEVPVPARRSAAARRSSYRAPRGRRRGRASVSGETDAGVVPVEAFVRSRGEGVDTSPDRLAARWFNFVDECSRGFLGTSQAYELALFTRLTLDELMDHPELGEDGSVTAVRDIVADADRRFDLLLGAFPVPGWQGEQPWARAVVRDAGPELCANWGAVGVVMAPVYRAVPWSAALLW